MPDVFRLAYVDLFTPALDDATRYYGDVLGMALTDESGDGAYLTLGVDHHNVRLQPSDREGLAAIGLQAVRGLPLSDIAKRLDDMGLPNGLRSDARPGVSSLLRVDDVGGHAFEIIEDMSIAKTPQATAGVAPFKLGHVAVTTPDPERLLAFLSGPLGFFTTDWFEETATFLTCNHDHHVMNVVAAPLATMHHLAFHLGGIDHQVRAADTLARHQVATVWGPARHTAGHNVAAYHHGADGALIELYSDLDVFVADLNRCEPRPWHEDFPQQPKRWGLDQMTSWETRYEFSMSAVTFGVPSQTKP